MCLCQIVIVVHMIQLHQMFLKLYLDNVNTKHTADNNFVEENIIMEHHKTAMYKPAIAVILSAEMSRNASGNVLHFCSQVS